MLLASKCGCLLAKLLQPMERRFACFGYRTIGMSSGRRVMSCSVRTGQARASILA